MKPTPIIWTKEKSNRLYDFVAQNSPKETMYFGYQVGKGILKFCSFFAETSRGGR